MAGTDIFGYKRQKPTEVFSTDQSSLIIAGSQGDKGVAGYLVQNWNFTYSHDVQEIYEIGSSNIYWVKGHSTGNGKLGRIIGAKSGMADIKFFSDKAYNACLGGDDLKITMRPSMCTNEAEYSETGVGTAIVTMTLVGCIVTAIGFTVTAQDVKIMEDLTIKFASLELGQEGQTGV